MAANVGYARPAPPPPPPLMFSLICASIKRLSKQSWAWLFETPTCSLWRHCNEKILWQLRFFMGPFIHDYILEARFYTFFIWWLFPKCHTIGQCSFVVWSLKISKYEQGWYSIVPLPRYVWHGHADQSLNHCNLQRYNSCVCRAGRENHELTCWCIDLQSINTLRPRQNGRHFPDDIFKCIFLNENVWISINISLKFVPRGPINNIPTLVQVMAWRRPGDKLLSEPMMVRLPTHICVT